MLMSLQRELQAAEELVDARPTDAAQLLRGVIFGHQPNDADSLKIKEQALDVLVAVLVKQQDAVALRSLLADLRPLFSAVPKAKTAKIVRLVIDSIATISRSAQILLEVCQEQAAWATAEKRTFLRQRIDLRLAALYLSTRNYTAALPLIRDLLSEVKRLDDKLLLVEVHLLESKAHSSLRNLPKARAALTAARTAANAIYVPPSLQADIDSQSGSLHAEENDFKTAYSYFYEAFEQLSALDDARAVVVLKYMLLCKVMCGDVGDVPGLIASKGGLKHAGAEVDAVRAVAKAYADRSLGSLQAALEAYAPQLGEDPVVAGHLAALYDTLLEHNLARVVEPYSRVEVAHIARSIALPPATVEGKLSQMILDKKIVGTLDQGVGTLEVFDCIMADAIYPAALETIANVARVVDTLHARSSKVAA